MSTETAMGTSEQNRKRDSVREEGDSEISTFHRPTAAGKFLVYSGKKVWIRGGTYGTFRSCTNEDHYADPPVRDFSFSHIPAKGLNAIRSYTGSTPSLFDLSLNYILRAM